MKNILLFVIALFFSLTSCKGQSREEVEQQTKKALGDWLGNPIIPDKKLNFKTYEQFKDSGRYEYGLKEGVWVQFILDTSDIGKSMNLVVESKELQMNLSARFIRETGRYKRGKREGKWTVHETNEDEVPLFWNITKVINYKEGEKNGEEIQYQGYGDSVTPLIVQNWKMGNEHGIGKIYDHNYPYHLKQVFSTISGQKWLVEEYYSNGNLKLQIKDSLSGGKELKYLSVYFENGKIRQMGFYFNEDEKYGKWVEYYENGNKKKIENYENGILNGEYQYFHENGQIWTEKVYANGLLWQVISNYDRNGVKKDKGTLKNGNGTLRVYNSEGQLSRIAEFVNGKEEK
ncbi:hypothetical protein C9994_00345 [Marivirga lumbricoides]|uniref:Toxin-antitoxin system YwqK family antitoxin n=1 Tax=Marivirga lumbricoides TaxID=1046115 RepID=A0A2T4DW67_9BACT|nr:hypothetical protein C9994_00345 [Marivirga lumbricoides]